VGVLGVAHIGERVIRPTDLRCEHRLDVPCVDDPAPRFGWTLRADRRDERQTGYAVVVAARAGDLAPGAEALWDTGRVASSDSVEVPYAGPPLPPGAELWWMVRVGDRDGEPSSWSAPARFRTGPATWQAQWIGRDDLHDPAVAVPDEPEPDPEADLGLAPCPHLRRRFVLDAPVRRAVLYATARGLVELHLNGTRVGDSVLAPGWTDYRRRIEYAAHDVTRLVREGENALGAILGDGWYAGYVGFDPKRRGAHYGSRPELVCELHVEHGDATTTVVASDGDWRAATGPLLGSDLLMGEHYDARLELGGWTQPGFDDTAWTRVACRPRDRTALVPERAQPIRVTADVPAVSVTERAPGVHVFDLGQNFAGWARLRTRGEPGDRIRLRFAEALDAGGDLHVANLGRARAQETYVLRGGGVEEYEPRFTFHGFRYVEATGLRGPVTTEAITGRVVHSDMPVAGAFACSSPLVDQIWRNALWGQRSNFISVPTDCPQRDERLGWMADAQVFLPTAILNMDVAAFMTKWGDDILDGQSAEGAYPDVVPRLVLERDGAPAWADAGVIVPWLVHRAYGDRRIVERHWDAMDRFMAYLERNNPGHLRTRARGNDYGDWLSIDADTPKDVLATAYWAHDAELMSRMAALLGMTDQVERYRRLRGDIVAAFNRAYVGPDSFIEGDTQTVYALALHMDLLPERSRARAAERLVADIRARDWHLSTGFAGVGLLCPVLAEAGHADVAYRLLLNETFPSWGYSIRHGATTIWERWDSWTEEGGFHRSGMNSLNHYALGSVAQWLYEYVAGIRLDAERPGYEHVVIAPVPGPLAWAGATYASVRGPIRSKWRQTETELELDVEIPANVTATVVLPGDDPPTEGGRAAGEAEGVRSVRRGAAGWAVDIGSGTFAFAVRRADPAHLTPFISDNEHTTVEAP
jgi:alpha-L-rhamnosidase